MKNQFATFGGGCFWGIEESLQNTPGVIDAVSGYSGGLTESPSYKSVCAGNTAHAEVVQVEFNPEKISYENLVKRFMSIHDPTERNPSNRNPMSQYRSIILYHSHEQKEVIEKVISEMQKSSSRQIKTEVYPLIKFHKAEDYHQDYYGACRKAE